MYFCSPHVAMALDGVEIFTNGSGNVYERGRDHIPVPVVEAATSKVVQETHAVIWYNVYMLLYIKHISNCLLI